MRFDILTLFPGIFSGYLEESLLKKAIEKGLIEVCLHDFRQWSRDKHHHVDDRPFGGGPGMVIKVEPIVECVEAVRPLWNESGRLILLTPQGIRLTQAKVKELASESRLTLICGRYEGFDQRIIDLLKPEEISIGDYVLNGGEVAAMAIVDAVIRLKPGVIGDPESHADESFAAQENGEAQWLEYPQYTRPREYRGLSAPEVLLSGDHLAIEQWRREQSFQRTKDRRRDLLG